MFLVFWWNKNRNNKDYILKALTLKKIKDELEYRSSKDLVELCLQLAKFKKENKELLTYLLFEAHNEEMYVESVKEYMDTLFEEMNTKRRVFFTSEKLSEKY